MKLVKKINKIDYGLPIWKLSIYFSGAVSPGEGQMVASIENTEDDYSIRLNKIILLDEQFEYYGKPYICAVTYCALGYDEVLSKYDEATEALYNQILKIEERIEQKYRKEMEIIISIRNSNLFQKYNRDERLKKII